MGDRKKVYWALAVVACLAIVLFAVLSGESSPRVPREPPPKGETASRPGPDAPARGRSTPGEPAQPGAPATSEATRPEPSAPATSPAELYRAHMAEMRKAILAGHRYPDESQPLASKTDLLLPHHVEPTMRGLSGGPAGGSSESEAAKRVRIVQHQDRLFVTPGQNAIASFEAMSEGKPASINITRSDLVREGKSGAPGTVVGHVTWKDDGVAPDEAAGDGTWTAPVVMPTDGVASGLTVFVDIDSNGEKGTLAFPFVQTASPPAKFTKTARWALEEGSIAFYVGIQVDRPGLYDIVARVYDNAGAPATYCRSLRQLTTDDHEVRLLAFGAVLLDEGAVPPLVLRDVEGHRLLQDTYPDRELVEEWSAGFKTAAFDVHKLSNDPAKDPDKQRRLDALDQATKAGLANIEAQPPAPASSH